jgi:hypothetical protein
VKRNEESALSAVSSSELAALNENTTQEPIDFVTNIHSIQLGRFARQYKSVGRLAAEQVVVHRALGRETNALLSIYQALRTSLQVVHFLEKARMSRSSNVIARRSGRNQASAEGSERLKYLHHELGPGWRRTSIKSAGGSQQFSCEATVRASATQACCRALGTPALRCNSPGGVAPGAAVALPPLSTVSNGLSPLALCKGGWKVAHHRPH